MTADAQMDEVQYDDPDLDDEYDEDLYDAYRTVSKAAVLSLVASLLGLTGLIFPALLIFPLMAILLGLLASYNIRRYPDELTGRGSAMLGLILGAILVVGGTSMHWHLCHGSPAWVHADLVPRSAAR